MDRLMSLVFLVLGIILAIYGVLAMGSFSSDVSRFFTGSPTDKTVWLMIGGILAIIIGMGGLMRHQTK